MKDKLKIPLSEEKKLEIWEEINDRFDPEYNDYISVIEFVCEEHGITEKDI